MRKVLAAIALFFIFAMYACNSEQDCPDLTLMGRTNCSTDTSWVCGCDGNTYLNECIANNKGAWVKEVGKCPE